MSTTLSTSRTYIAMIIAFVAMLAATEGVLTYYSVVLGAAMHAILVAGLLLLYILASPIDAGPSRSSLPFLPSSPLLPVLAQVSLLRLMSLVIPIQQISEVYWYPMVGLPVLLGAALTARLLGFSWRDLGLTRCPGGTQLVIAASGIPLGLVGYLTVRPVTDVDSDALATLILTALFLIIFSGFLEEFLFRGLLQNIAFREFGKLAIVWTSVIFGIMYVGTGSVEYALFMGACGLLFGWAYAQTSSLWGVTIAHALLSVGLLIVFPLLLNG